MIPKFLSSHAKHYFFQLLFFRYYIQFLPMVVDNSNKLGCTDQLDDYADLYNQHELEFIAPHKRLVQSDLFENFVLE